MEEQSTALSHGQLFALLSLPAGHVSCRCCFRPTLVMGKHGEEGPGSSAQQVMNGPIPQSRVSPAWDKGFVTAAIVYVPGG